DPEAYFLGDDVSELRRLEFQAAAWRGVTLALCRTAGMGPGARVVDLGCGPGFLTIDLASIVGETGHVIAVDRSTTFLSALPARIRTQAGKSRAVLRHD